MKTTIPTAIFEPELVAKRLTAFREEAGLTVDAIAKATGFSRSGIEKMENPELSNPTVKSIELYCTACNRTLGEFFRPWRRERTTA